VSLVVQKVGGASFADPERIKRVAQRVVATAESGARVCVVVSATGGRTDMLLELTCEISPRPHPREQDMALTAGERTGSVAPAGGVRARRPGVPGEDAAEGVCEVGE
jgi:aspartate kinase